MLEFSCPPSARRIAQLERPQKVVCLLEIRSNRENLMNQILNTLNSVFAQRLSNEGIIRQWNTRTAYLSVSTLVNEVTDRLEVGFAVGDVRLDNLEHFLSRFGMLDEDSIVDLQETKELHNFTRFGRHFIDTDMLTTESVGGIPFDTDNEEKFWLSGDVEISLFLRETF